MSDQPETATYYMNPFYDSVFATLNTPIPSKRVRYHINDQNQTVTLHERESGKRFDATVRHLFRDDHSPSWPLQGPLFMGSYPISVTRVQLAAASARSSDRWRR